MSEENRREEELRPVEEAGGGEAEGFEQAEDELIEHASHGDPAPDPSELSGEPEDPGGGESTYGDADHERSSETPDTDE
jgi:hypothetical protein